MIFIFAPSEVKYSLLSKRWVNMVIDWVTDYIGEKKREVEKSMQLRYRRLTDLNTQNTEYER